MRGPLAGSRPARKPRRRHAALGPLLPASADTLVFRGRLADAFRIDGSAVLVERRLLELVDKTLAAIVAAAVVTLLEERFPGVLRAGDAQART